LILDHLVSEENEHIKTVRAKELEREQAEERRKQLKADQASEKQQRKEEREAKKRAQELEKLKEEIRGKFMENGGQSASVPDIMAQEFFEINGNAGQNTVGAVGGVLGQMILCLNIIEKNFNR
jgi:hypothetical protein